MFDGFDKDCPFCEMKGTVNEYAEETKAFRTLYQCGNCMRIFDESKREHRKNEIRRLQEERLMKNVEKKVKKEKEKEKERFMNYKKFFICFLSVTIYYYFL